MKVKVRKRMTIGNNGSLLATEKGISEAKEMADILLAFCPDPPQESEKAQQELRNRLLASHRELTMEKSPIKVGVVTPFWLHARTLVAAGVVALLLVGLAVFLSVAIPGRQLRTEIARLDIVEGTVRVRRPGSGEEVAVNGMMIGEGTSVITDEGARAVVELEDGSEARLDQGSEIGIEECDEGSVELEQGKGNVYHKVADDTGHIVRYEDLEVSGTNTAYNMYGDDGDATVTVVEGDVEVDRDDEEDGDAGSREISAGEQAWVTSVNDERAITVRPFDPSILEDSWYVWNRIMDGEYSQLIDASQGSVLCGMLLVTERAQLQETEATQPSRGVAEPPKPSAEEPSLVPEPEPEPDNTLPEPLPSNLAEITLGATKVNSSSVVLKWEVSGDSDYDSVELMRSGTNSLSTCTQDNKWTVDNKETNTCTDTSVESGMTYDYRACVISEGTSVAYSDSITVIIPVAGGSCIPWQVKLSAVSKGTVVALNWKTSGPEGGEFDGYRIRRIDGSTKAEQIVGITSEKLSGSYSDYSVTAGHKYTYRLEVYRGGETLATSLSQGVSIVPKIKGPPDDKKGDGMSEILVDPIPKVVDLGQDLESSISLEIEVGTDLEGRKPDLMIR